MSDSARHGPSDADAAVRQQFGRVAAHYASSPVFARGADLAELIRVAAPSPDDVALDLGTAAGHAALALAPHIGRVVGVDLVPEMIEQAAVIAAERGVANIEFRVANAEDLPFADDSFDLVITRFSVHHWPSPLRAFHEVARVLRRGGRFVAIDTISPPDPEADRVLDTIEHLRDSSHHRSLSTAEWLTELSQVGLRGTIESLWDLELDFDDWVARMQTPPETVETIRRTMDEAPEEPRQILNVTHRDGATVFTLPCALILAVADEAAGG